MSLEEAIKANTDAVIGLTKALTAGTKSTAGGSPAASPTSGGSTSGAPAGAGKPGPKPGAGKPGPKAQTPPKKEETPAAEEGTEGQEGEEITIETLREKARALIKAGQKEAVNAAIRESGQADTITTTDPENYPALNAALDELLGAGAGGDEDNL